MSDVDVVSGGSVATGTDVNGFSGGRDYVGMRAGSHVTMNIRGQDWRNRCYVKRGIDNQPRISDGYMVDVKGGDNALWHNYNYTRTLLFYQEIFDSNRIQLTPKSNGYDLQTASRGRAICAVNF